ncbi:MAG: lipid-A-disaccharide synthase [Gammaproteobacteria bacterium]|nr:lipid-A-disaccharide synthase [Gammaproteobacteria bacterium]
MTKSLNFGIIAGEKSGDILGAALMTSLRRKFPAAKFVGIGGSEMLSLGCESLAKIDRLSVMGFIEPLARLPELLRLKKRLEDRFLREEIAVFIGIDSPDFNLRVARNLHSKGIKTVHFVSPSVWAYRKWRIFGIKKSVDLMLTLFPFESEIYMKHDIPVSCVGHPLADRIGFEDRKLACRKVLGISETKTVITLMPGSRAGEISRLAPIFFSAAGKSLQKHSNLEFLIPYSGEEAKSLLTAQLDRDRMLSNNKLTMMKNSHKAISASDLVIMASGTASLEAMLLRRPMIICYKLAPLSYVLGSLLLKVPYIGLPNLLARKMLVPEYLQGAVTAGLLIGKIDEFLASPSAHEEVLEQFDNIHKMLRRGASEKAAYAIGSLIGEV